MKLEKIISSLLGIERDILECYHELAAREAISASLKNSNAVFELYEKIRMYRDFEDIMLSKIYDICSSQKAIYDLKDSLCDFYGIFDAIGTLFMYVNDFDKGIVARRLIDRISIDFVFSDDSVIDIPHSNLMIEEDNDGDEKKEDFALSSDPFFYEKDILCPLMEYEDTIRLIQKIDTSSLPDFEMCGPYSLDLDVEKLKRIKYDMFFLNRHLESMLIGDYVVPSYFDSKWIASVKFGLNDERILQAYDSIREIDILNMAEVLSQKKNCSSCSIKNSLRYLLIDLWADSLTDEKLADIFNKLEDRVTDSYSQEIMSSRRDVYNILYDMYSSRVMDYEVVIEESVKGEELAVVKKKK